MSTRNLIGQAQAILSRIYPKTPYSVWVAQQIVGNKSYEWADTKWCFIVTMLVLIIFWFPRIFVNNIVWVQLFAAYSE